MKEVWDTSLYATRCTQLVRHLLVRNMSDTSLYATCRTPRCMQHSRVCVHVISLYSTFTHDMTFCVSGQEASGILCNTLQYTLQRTLQHALQHTATIYNTLQRTVHRRERDRGLYHSKCSVCCSVLQSVAVCVAVCCRA